VKDNLRNRLQKLLATESPPEIGPGPRRGMRSLPELEAELDSILRDASSSEGSGELIRGLVLLWHDHLDASHTISQSIENPDGSFLHAIMHRREPDYWNSKYWWRRVGKHPCFSELGKRAGAFLNSHHEEALRAKLIPRGEWDAGAFVDSCEAAAKEPTASKRTGLLRELQRLESEVLLDHFL
jgi:hypothetical protein